MMDDKPAVEYHPFGTITLNFDDGPVKLRRCRLGDLEFGKNLLEEIRQETTPRRQALAAEAVELRDKYTPKKRAKAQPQAELDTAVTRMNEVSRQLEQARVEIVWEWLAKVATRMGDAPLPPKEDWPLEMLHSEVPNEIIDHWQSRPLASGKTLGNRPMTSDQGNSGPPLHIVSSPQEPQPQ